MGRLRNLSQGAWRVDLSVSGSRQGWADCRLQAQSDTRCSRSQGILQKGDPVWPDGHFSHTLHLPPLMAWAMANACLGTNTAQPFKTEEPFSPCAAKHPEARQQFFRGFSFGLDLLLDLLEESIQFGIDFKQRAVFTYRSHCVVSSGSGDLSQAFKTGSRVEGQIHAARRCVFARLLAAICPCPVHQGVLKRNAEGGGSTSYSIALASWTRDQ
jgi:hypothetical protein